MALTSDGLSCCRHTVEANDVCLRSKQLLSGGHQVFVMAKESHLRLLRKVKEGLERRLRAVVIKIYEEGCRPLVEVDVEPLKGTLGQSLEHSARAFKHRTLLLVLLAFYSPPHEHV